jgi:hypothetical protein
MEKILHDVKLCRETLGLVGPGPARKEVQVQVSGIEDLQLVFGENDELARYCSSLNL